jgi:hypothetical protein
MGETPRRGAQHTERIAKIVDDVLIRSCYRPSRSFLTDAVRSQPIGIHITARQPRATWTYGRANPSPHRARGRS